ncbi:hypothetical protein G7062_03015 [Erysipelothrix sp. HDW6C]|uniref:hypothetical protein n=1 Tax=Erysipelothrix sp. HDW6C TaxID=2714930 RepID=UPI00140D9AB4|nr:hypothetical protein [Erysipelothrix sp. HDW6C]QIK69326.1 hypothetical protein G7062_03015 [Erysipelothrix sp. HDW6C]
MTQKNTKKKNDNKKNNSSYNKAVLMSIVLLFMGIFDKILYPNNDWPLLRMANYIVMLALFIAIVMQFIKMMKDGKKGK